MRGVEVSNAKALPSLGRPNRRQVALEVVNDCVKHREKLIDELVRLGQLLEQIRSRQTIDMVRKVLSGLREAGCQVVEAIEAWRATKPEQGGVFLWEGRDYLVKMGNDLDFVSEAKPLLDAVAPPSPHLLRSNPLMCPRSLDDVSQADEEESEAENNEEEVRLRRAEAVLVAARKRDQAVSELLLESAKNKIPAAAAKENRLLSPSLNPENWAEKARKQLAQLEEASRCQLSPGKGYISGTFDEPAQTIAITRIRCDKKAGKPSVKGINTSKTMRIPSRSMRQLTRAAYSEVSGNRQRRNKRTMHNNKQKKVSSDPDDDHAKTIFNEYSKVLQTSWWSFAQVDIRPCLVTVLSKPAASNNESLFVKAYDPRRSLEAQLVLESPLVHTLRGHTPLLSFVKTDLLKRLQLVDKDLSVRPGPPSGCAVVPSGSAPSAPLFLENSQIDDIGEKRLPNIAAKSVKTENVKSHTAQRSTTARAPPTTTKPVVKATIKPVAEQRSTTAKTQPKAIKPMKKEAVKPPVTNECSRTVRTQSTATKPAVKAKAQSDPGECNPGSKLQTPTTKPVAKATVKSVTAKGTISSKLERTMTKPVVKSAVKASSEERATSSKAQSTEPKVKTATLKAEEAPVSKPSKSSNAIEEESATKDQSEDKSFNDNKSNATFEKAPAVHAEETKSTVSAQEQPRLETAAPDADEDDYQMDDYDDDGFFDDEPNSPASFVSQNTKKGINDNRIHSSSPPEKGAALSITKEDPEAPTTTTAIEAPISDGRKDQEVKKEVDDNNYLSGGEFSQEEDYENDDFFDDPDDDIFS